MKNKGFTLIELLVVISVIGILLTVVFSGVNRAHKKAKISHFVQELKQIENAFMYSYLEENRNTWWTESEIGRTNPSLQYIIDINSGPLSGFSNYLKNPPENLLNSSSYKYDNDNDTDNSCVNGGAENRGVSLFISNLDYSTALELDRYIDKEESYSCGKIRYQQNPSASGKTHLIYGIGKNSEDIF